MATVRNIIGAEGQLRTEMIPLDGGFNESVSSLELKPGELISCKNFYLTEGSTGGYVALSGYERYNGMTKPSSVSATELDDVAREAARTAITEIPGSGSIRGVYIFQGKVYAFRDNALGTAGAMWVEDPTGWVEIDTSADPLAPGGTYSFITYNFYATAAGEAMFFVNGEQEARMFDGTTLTTIATGMGANDKPIFVAAHNERLFLTFLGGSLQYSTSGAPTDWTTDAGEIGAGGEITGLVETVGGTLVIFGTDFIKTLEGNVTSEWILRTFSDAMGARAYTICTLFDTIIFMSEMGVTTLSAAQEFGDFAANAISEKIKKTLARTKDMITCAVAVKPLNQYRLFFSNGKGLVFSFSNKKLKGITSIEYPNAVNLVTEGLDTSENPVIFFASIAGGQIYQMDSGTSFDGGVIEVSLSTAFYHYKSPRNWKRFMMFTFEIIATDTITLSIRRDFDYRASWAPRSLEREFDVTLMGSFWGEGEWGTMIWAGTESTNRIFYHTQGLGSNMNVSLKTSSKYNRSFTLQNFITDFILLGRQL